jgi:hypothetical protein
MLQMPRQPARRDQHGVDAEIVAGPAVARDQDFGRRGDA